MEEGSDKDVKRPWQGRGKEDVAKRGEEQTGRATEAAKAEGGADPSANPTWQSRAVTWLQGMQSRRRHAPPTDAHTEPAPPRTAPHRNKGPPPRAGLEDCWPLRMLRAAGNLGTVSAAWLSPLPWRPWRPRHSLPPSSLPSSRLPAHCPPCSPRARSPGPRMALSA